MSGIVEELTTVLGAAKVAVDAATLAAYAVDQAPVLDYQLPQAVVRAESVADVQAAVAPAPRTASPWSRAAPAPASPAAPMPARAAWC